jgi:hypothetical protein
MTIAMHRPTTARRLQPHDQKYQDREAHFTRTWSAGKGACPHVVGIMEIHPPGHIEHEFWTYAGNLSRTKFNGDATKVNVRTAWHGTLLATHCKLLTHNQFCTAGCGVCGITNTGFDKTKVGQSALSQAMQAGGFKRFGHGFYFGYNSSKSHDYSVAANKNPKTMNGKPVYCLLICKVIAGDVAKLTADDQTLIAPPGGCDSVVGEAGHGNLNYAELVVYRADACISAYAVFYQ